MPESYLTRMNYHAFTSSFKDCRHALLSLDETSLPFVPGCIADWMADCNGHDFLTYDVTVPFMGRSIVVKTGVVTPSDVDVRHL